MFKRCFLILTLGFFLISCGGSRRTTSKRIPNTDRSKNVKVEREISNTNTSVDNGVNPVPKTGVNGYIDFYAPIAMEEMKLYGVPASITLAQGILESGAGNGELVRKANNHFGIKCHSWEGDRVYHDDDEKGECFRKYNDPKFSYRDHSLFLAKRKRYADLFTLSKDDYKGWAKGLRKAGYATDKKYPEKLISLIERFELYRYDGKVLGKQIEDYNKISSKREDTSSNTRHIVQKGENLYRISKRYNVSVEDIKKWNNLRDDTISLGQILLIKD